VFEGLLPSCGDNTTLGPPGQNVPMVMVQDPLIRGIVLLKIRLSHNMNSVSAPMGWGLQGIEVPERW